MLRTEQTPWTGARLAAIHATLTCEGNLDGMLGHVLDATLKECGVGFGGIFLTNPAEQGLALAVHQGVTEAVASRFMGIPWEDSYSAYILDQPQPTVVDDLYQDSVLARLPRHPLHDAGFRSLAAQPLLADNGLQGMIYLASREPGGISPEAADFLASLAGPVVLGIQKGRLRAALEVVQMERDELHGQLLHAQKLELIGRLRGGLVHDLNNLLSVVLSFSEVGLEDVRPGEALWESMTEIHRAAVGACDLTRQILSFSRRLETGRQRVDPVGLARELVRMLERLLGEDVDLRICAAEGVGSVVIAPNQLELALANLAVNARDAMPAGGRLTLEICERTFGPVEVRAWPHAVPGTFVVLAVRDTGTGMLPEVRSRLFEPFFTTKSLGRGTGLGLATVKDTITRAGGFIEVDSQPGHGTEVRLCLPRAAQADRQQTYPKGLECRTPGRSPQGQGRVVLVVDDDDAVRKVARTILGRHGYQVLEASNGREALELLRARAPRVDLVVTDVVMPVIGGLELARELRGLLPSVPVLFMTGHFDSNGEAGPFDGEIEDGAAVLLKPFDVESLLEAVASSLKTGAPSDDQALLG